MCRQARCTSHEMILCMCSIVISQAAWNCHVVQESHCSSLTPVKGLHSQYMSDTMWGNMLHRPGCLSRGTRSNSLGCQWALLWTELIRVEWRALRYQLLPWQHGICCVYRHVCEAHGPNASIAWMIPHICQSTAWMSPYLSDFQDCKIVWDCVMRLCGIV